MCIDELLKLKLTQQALSLHRHEEWIDGVLDGSLRLIDGCGIIREVISQIREHIRDLQSALRRRKGDSSAGSSIARYTCFRNKVKKDAKKLMEEVKQIDKRIEESSLFGLDNQVSSVISILREVVVASSSIFHSILLFLSISTLKPKATRWSLVSRLKGTVVGEDRHIKVTELENVDFSLHTRWKCSCERDGKQIAQNRLGPLKMSIEAVENCLECLFRTVIRARASILNVVSLM
ncbi:Pyridoxal 5'-phosphate synthase subunit PdxS like [Actinidia chinensis var. chinensis]|uniref:Pyridoxal 5'-phosphate synthase subunit PdxS like n=1 Tax=Actinidia chinensis var. chinensis TaxID=1590841 RepID=A0A2R6RIU3_ACTCC|nr:Pyridoxal 5'-phosphate synthase subunit PdxS like [Actinidia chinensis var. chinensis]